MKAISHYWPKECLFLLTHAGWCVPALTALLTHQLGLAGMGCSGLSYESTSDLTRLRWRIARHDRTWPCGRYMFDVLASNDQYLSVELAESLQARAVMCIPRPAETLLGMVRSGNAASMSSAEYSYRLRLDWLTAAGRRLAEHVLVFPAEMVVEDTNTLLAAIALHIGMEQSFTPVAQSQLDEHEDDEGSELTPSRAPPVIELEAHIAERCEDAYADALLELSRNCLSIGILGAPADQGSKDPALLRFPPSQMPPRRGQSASNMVCNRLSEGTLQ